MKRAKNLSSNSAKQIFYIYLSERFFTPRLSVAGAIFFSGTTRCRGISSRTQQSTQQEDDTVVEKRFGKKVSAEFLLTLNSGSAKYRPQEGLSVTLGPVLSRFCSSFQRAMINCSSCREKLILACDIFFG